MNELKLPEPDTHCLDDEGGRPIDVWSYSPELVRQIVAADRAQKSARHREELLAYEVTVGNLRADIALTCDFCGCETPDPWHGSTATNRHVHACDMCRPKLAQPQGEPVASIYITLDGDREFDDWKAVQAAGRTVLYTHPAHTEAEVQELLDSTEGRHEVTIRRILGVPA